MIEFILASSTDEYNAAAALFRKYANWLGIDLCFQGFEKELTQLQVMYGQPAGGIILCKDEHVFIGCVGVRRIADGIAELKRMYVLPEYQHRGIGSDLLTKALDLSNTIGYKLIRLDTLDHMEPAIKLYRRAGFYEIPAYYHNPESTAIYFEKKLDTKSDL